MSSSMSSCRVRGARVHARSPLIRFSGPPAIAGGAWSERESTGVGVCKLGQSGGRPTSAEAVDIPRARSRSSDRALTCLPLRSFGRREVFAVGAEVGFRITGTASKNARINRRLFFRATHKQGSRPAEARPKIDANAGCPTFFVPHFVRGGARRCAVVRARAPAPRNRHAVCRALSWPTLGHHASVRAHG